MNLKYAYQLMSQQQNCQKHFSQIYCTYYDLYNKFCDGTEGEDSWENTLIPDQGLIFFLTFYRILRSRIMKSEMLDATSDETTCDDIDETVYCEKKAWPTNRLGYP